MFLIDTDIIIYSLKGHDRVIRNFTRHLSSTKSISVITYGELRFGAAKSRHKAKNLAVVKRIGELFPVIELTPRIMDVYAEIKAGLQKKGHPIDDFDLLNAATALYLNLTIVSNNEKHYQPIKGLRVVNWAI